MARRRGDSADRVEKNRRRVVRLVIRSLVVLSAPVEELLLRDDGEVGRDLGEVVIHELGEHLALDILAAPRVTLVVVVLGRIDFVLLVDLDEPFSGSAHAPCLVIPQIERVDRGHGRGRVQDVCQRCRP